MKSVAHVCSTSSGLDELTRRQQANARHVLAHLEKAGRFSVFEATANQIIAKTMDGIADRKMIEVDPSLGYPWSAVTLTDAGRERRTGAEWAAKNGRGFFFAGEP